MAREVPLDRLDTVLSSLDYPVSRETVLTECEDVTLQLADGTETLTEVLVISSEDSFESMDELTNELMSLLPRHAVGEPYQSEGEGD